MAVQFFFGTFHGRQPLQLLAPISLVNGSLVRLRTMAFPCPGPLRLRNFTLLPQRSPHGHLHLLLGTCLFHCDNQLVAHILSSGTSRCTHIMSMLRYLFYVSASHNIVLRAVHIPGVTNCFADCLSRLQVTKFHRLCPTASKHPTFVPRVPLTNFM